MEVRDENSSIKNELIYNFLNIWELYVKYAAKITHLKTTSQQTFKVIYYMKSACEKLQTKFPL